MSLKNAFPKGAAAFLDMDGTLYPLPGGFCASPVPRRLRAAYVALLRTALPRAAAESAYERMSADAGNIPLSGAVASFLSYPGGRAAVLARVWGKVSTRGVVRAAHSVEARKAVARLRAAYGALYLVTGAPRCWARRVLGTLGLADAFDGVFCLEDHGGQKSVSFSNVLARGYSPSSCLSVGDQDETDLVPARALGMGTLLVSGPREILS